MKQCILITLGITILCTSIVFLLAFCNPTSDKVAFSITRDILGMVVVISLLFSMILYIYGYV